MLHAIGQAGTIQNRMQTVTESRLPSLALVLSVIAGAFLTGYGWFTAEPDTWSVSPHLSLFCWLLPVALLLVTWRCNALAAGLAMAFAVGVASNSLGAMLVVVLLGWSATTLGRLLLSRLPSATEVECLLVGLCAYGTLVGLLAHWPVNYPGVYATMLGLPLLSCRRFALATAKNALQRLQERRTYDDLHRLISCAIVAIAGVYLLVALMPETGHDALATHLFVPTSVAWRHVWEFDVGLYAWTCMPMLTDWIYTIAYMLAGETASRLVNLSFIMLLGRLIYDLVQWLGGDRRCGYAAVLLYLTTPLTMRESSTLLIEAFWSCLVVAGTISLFRIAERRTTEANRDRRHIVIAGALLGGSLAAKAVSMTVLPVLALVLLWSWRQWLRRECASVALVGLAAFLVIGGAPYAHSHLLTGNPVFPFFNAIFESPHYPSENFSAPRIFDKGMSWDVLYRITFESKRFLEGLPGSAGFHWLLLVLPVAVAALVARHRRMLFTLAVAGSIVWVTFQQTAYLRYAFPSFALIAAVVGAGLGTTLGTRPGARMLLGIAALVAVTLGLMRLSYAGFHANVSLPALVSSSHRDEYLTRHSPIRSAIQLINEHNENLHPVAFFASLMPCGLHADALLTGWYNYRFRDAILAATTTDKLGTLLARKRVRYVILDSRWHQQEVRQLIKDVTVEVHDFGGISVRKTNDAYRFQTELLSNGEFRGDAAWQPVGGAARSEGPGTTVTLQSNLMQQVPVIAGNNYKLSAQVRRETPDRPAKARLQVTWLDKEGRSVKSNIRVVPCLANGVLHSMEAVAPAGSTSALIRAVSHTSEPVIFDNISFRN